MKSNVEDKLKDKIEEEDKEKVLEAVKEALEWMEENSDAGGCRGCCHPQLNYFSLLCLAVPGIIAF